MRVRSRVSGGVQNIPYAGTVRVRLGDFQDPNTPWSVSATPSWGTTDQVEESISDIVTPDFKRKISEGQIINNPLIKSKRTTHYPNVVSYNHHTFDVNSYGHKVGYEWSGDMVPYEMWDGYFRPRADLLDVSDLPSATLASLRQQVIDLAVTSAHANVDTSEMLALASIAEGRKTVDSICSILWRAIRIAKDVRSANIAGLRKQLSPKQLAARYMELRYAVRPLIYDVNGVIAALNSQRASSRKTFRGFASDRYDHTDSYGEDQAFYQCLTEINRKASYEVSARAGVLCDVTIDDVSVYGLDQLFETAWELTPFSFVFDWFANIGDTIAALTPNAGVKQLASWVTVKESFTTTNSSGATRSTATWPDTVTTVSPFSWGYNTLGVERIVNPQLSVFPQMNLRFDAFKILDLGIILRQILR